MEKEISNLLKEKRKRINSLKEILKGISRDDKEKAWDWLITTGHLYREGKVEKAHDMAVFLAEYLQEEKAKETHSLSKNKMEIWNWFKSLKDKLENILNVIRKFKS